MDTIDARGLSCPQPVIMVTRAVVEGKTEFTVLVDSEASFENVTRYLESKKYTCKTEEKDDHTVISASK
ncbi:MAG TPA: sulfurtransferase TusA family protein [Clostridiales bacterium]|nr:sulfurtransferase TusA family protein [Clostridiales bacterium]